MVTLEGTFSDNVSSPLMVSMLVIKPKERNSEELKWDHITGPDVIRSADKTPVSSQGLGLTIWYAWVWWVIRHYHVLRG